MKNKIIDILKIIFLLYILHLDLMRKGVAINIIL